MTVNKPFKILMVTADEFGCGLYRMRQPAYSVGKHTADVDILLNMNPSTADLKDQDLLIIQRVRVCKNEQTKEITDLNVELLHVAKHYNIPIIYEHDDNDFALPKHHGMYTMFLEDRIADKVDFMLENADVITTTTHYLADVFRNRISDPQKVFVFPNCLDSEDKMWQFRRPFSQKLRIGWAGGSSHQYDLSEFRGVAETLYEKYSDQLLFLMGGFDTRGVYTYYNEKGERITRPIEAHETVWIEMADEFFGKIPKAARRIMRTLPIDQYGYFFSQFDIGIIPLQSDEFCRAKSSLKLLEFGAYNVPCAFSDVVPYNLTMKGTKLYQRVKIPTGKSKRGSHDDWVRVLSDLIDSEALREEIGQELNRLILTKFDADKWAPLRFKFWKEVIESKGKPETPNPERDIEGWDKISF